MYMDVCAFSVSACYLSNTGYHFCTTKHTNSMSMTLYKCHLLKFCHSKICTPESSVLMHIVSVYCHCCVVSTTQMYFNLIHNPIVNACFSFFPIVNETDMSILAYHSIIKCSLAHSVCLLRHIGDSFSITYSLK